MSEKKKRSRGAVTPPGEGEADAPPGSAAGTTGGSAGSSTRGGPMNVRLLEQIVKLMAANDLNTVDVRDGDQRIILKRGPAGATVTYAAPMPAPIAQPALSQSPAAAGASPGAPGVPAAAADDTAGLLPIKAEMVGTFYAAPKPGEKAFVTVGSDVDADTEVCLIEAMKNYFAVKAGVSGTIARVLVQDGQTVQFDQVLFLVRPK